MKIGDRSAIFLNESVEQTEKNFQTNRTDFTFEYKPQTLTAACLSFREKIEVSSSALAFDLSPPDRHLSSTLARAASTSCDFSLNGNKRQKEGYGLYKITPSSFGSQILTIRRVLTHFYAEQTTFPCQEIPVVETDRPLCSQELCPPSRSLLLGHLKPCRAANPSYKTLKRDQLNYC